MTQNILMPQHASLAGMACYGGTAPILSSASHDRWPLRSCGSDGGLGGCVSGVLSWSIAYRRASWPALIHALHRSRSPSS